jgi:hypothetical protein
MKTQAPFGIHARKRPALSLVVCLSLYVAVLLLSTVGYHLASDIGIDHSNWSVGVASISPNN